VEWHSRVAVVDAALAGFAATGDALEMAGGTGLFTQRLARIADRLTVVGYLTGGHGAQPTARRTAGLLLSYGDSDLFEWRPERSYDVVFSWLSHVPRHRLGAFWSSARECLAPGGRVFLVDNRIDPTAKSKLTDPFLSSTAPICTCVG
jgi:hypothetical protein